MDEQRFDFLMQMAIAQEVAAHEFYAEAARRARDGAVRKTFEDLARDEKEHRNILETYRYDPTARVSFAAAPADFGVAEASDAPDTDPSFDMSPADALRLAIKKEQRAMEAYQRFARATASPDVRQIYEDLARMEQGHKTRLEALFVDVAFPEAW